MDIVTRPQWGFAEEAGRPRMRLPATALWLHHSVTGVTKDPKRDMRAIQKIGIQRFGYISYSYAVHPDGTVLEGQGLRVGAHTAGRNSTSFGVVLIGDYMNRVVTPAQVNSVRQLIADLVAAGALQPGTYPTGGHRDVAATKCPGDWAYRALAEFRQPWVTSDPPASKVAPMYDPPIAVVGKVVATLQAPGGGVWMLTDVGAVYAWLCDDKGAPNRHPEYWSHRVAARLEPHDLGYAVVDSDGNRYEYP